MIIKILPSSNSRKLKNELSISEEWSTQEVERIVFHWTKKLVCYVFLCTYLQNDLAFC